MLERERFQYHYTVTMHIRHKGCYRKLSSSSRTVQKVEYGRRHLDRRGSGAVPSYRWIRDCHLSVQRERPSADASSIGKLKGKRKGYARPWHPAIYKTLSYKRYRDFETACFLRYIFPSLFWHFISVLISAFLFAFISQINSYIPYILDSLEIRDTNAMQSLSRISSGSNIKINTHSLAV